MLALGLGLALLISLAALAYVVWPLLKPGPAPVILENDRLTDLIGRKDAVLAAIKDLEFDYYTGKLSEEDYQRLDQRLRRQAIGLIQQIEKVAPESAQLDAQIEAEIARLRKTHDPVPALASTARAQPIPAAAAAPAPVSTLPMPTSTAVRFCTNCGQPVDPSHKFCANCGQPLAAQAATAVN